MTDRQLEQDYLRLRQLVSDYLGAECVVEAWQRSIAEARASGDYARWTERGNAAAAKLEIARAALEAELDRMRGVTPVDADAADAVRVEVMAAAAYMADYHDGDPMWRHARESERAFCRDEARQFLRHRGDYVVTGDDPATWRAMAAAAQAFDAALGPRCASPGCTREAAPAFKEPPRFCWEHADGEGRP